MQVEIQVNYCSNIVDRAVVERDGTWTFGRGRDADIQLPDRDEALSRVHFALSIKGDSVRIQDLQSTNGVKLNGGTVQQAEIQDGDIISVGDTDVLLGVMFDDRLRDQSTIQLPTQECSEETVTFVPLPTESPERLKCVVCDCRLHENELDRGDQHRQDPRGLCVGCEQKLLSYPQPLKPYYITGRVEITPLGTRYRAIRRTSYSAVDVVILGSLSNVARQNVSRFFTEIKRISAISDAGIQKAFEAGTSLGKLFVTYPVTSGHSIARTLQRRGPFRIRQAMQALVHVLGVLEKLHQSKCSLGVMLPEDVWIFPESANRRVELANVGLFRSMHQSRVFSIVRDGLPNDLLSFTAPEAVCQPDLITPASDVYAAGCLLDYLLAGETPYCDSKARVRKLDEIMSDDRTLMCEMRQDVSEPIRSVIKTATCIEPTRRWSSATEFLDALNQAALSL